MHKISCIIPTCNRGELLSQAIRSVLAQTREPAEILVVNNGSEPVNLLPELAQRVAVYEIVRFAGAAQARNFGAVMAKGHYLAFLDDDDLWEVSYLAKVEQAINSGAKCTVARLDKLEGGKVLPFKNAHGKLSLNNLLVYNPGITGSNLAIAKEAFLEVGGFDPKLPPSEDKGLLVELLKAGIAITPLPEAQAIVRVHDGIRLSDAKRLAEGAFEFTRKYQSLMSWKQYLMNWLKIYRCRHEAGQALSFFPFVFLYILFRILKVW